jgi:transcriptional regulator with XRE-family HTH domain
VKAQLTTYAELADVIANLPMLCRENRRRLGLSTRAAASQIGCSFATISRFERGEDCSLSNAVLILRWIAKGGTP